MSFQVQSWPTEYLSPLHPAVRQPEGGAAGAAGAVRQQPAGEGGAGGGAAALQGGAGEAVRGFSGENTQNV